MLPGWGKSAVSGAKSAVSAATGSKTSSPTIKAGTWGKIVSGTKSAINTIGANNRTFESVNPWEDYFNANIEEGKIKNQYSQEHKEQSDSLTNQKYRSFDSLGTNLGKRGLMGGGGTAKYENQQTGNLFEQAFRDMGRTQAMDVKSTLEQLRGDALTSYMLKQKDYDTKNFLKIK